MSSDPSSCTQFDTFTYEIIGSTAGVRSDLYNRPLNEALITDFFGGVSDVELDQDHGSLKSDLTSKEDAEDSVMSQVPPLLARPPPDFQARSARELDFQPLHTRWMAWAGASFALLQVGVVLIVRSK